MLLAQVDRSLSNRLSPCLESLLAGEDCLQQSRRARSTDTMSKANVAHETLVRAREADKRREAELRIEARQQRQINERIQEANNQVEARMLSLLTFCVLLPVCRVLTAALTLRLNACTTAGNDTN